MAVFSGSLFSKVLQMDTNFTVVTPRKNLESGKVYPAVYLLHGLTDGHASWRNNTQISLLAEQYQVFFLMPDAARSFYMDAKYGMRYFTYLSEEFPTQCQNLFHIASSRQNVGVMGLSMGGYGALRCALQRPDRFGFCGAFSSCTDLNLIQATVGEQYPEACGILGLQYEDLAQNNLDRWIENASVAQDQVRYYATVGTEDDLLNINRKFRDCMQQAGMQYTYEEFAGKHDWYFWNTSIDKAMKHFFKANN